MLGCLSHPPEIIRHSHVSPVVQYIYLDTPAINMMNDGTTVTKRSKKKERNRKALEKKDDTPSMDSVGAHLEDVDQMFDQFKRSKKKMKLDIQAQEAREEIKAQAEKQKRKDLAELEKKFEKAKPSSHLPSDTPSRYDPDGLAIYSTDQLQLGKGGDTKDCPFDCWCCF